MPARVPRQEGQPGSPSWVRERLRAMPADDGWSRVDACRELIGWLYPVAVHRAGMIGVPPSDRREVAQDAMPSIVSALKRTRAQIANANNPAALLEHITARAISGGAHRLRMAGMGGVSPNGRHWLTPGVYTLGGDLGWDLLEAVPYGPDRPCREVEQAAAQVARWVAAHLDVRLNPDARHAVVYVLDRLAAGVGRAALVRGGHTALADDPAMRHLGFEPSGSRTFARWLLGRSDARHGLPSVLDAAVLGKAFGPDVLADWRRAAIQAGFAVEGRDAGITPLRARPASRWATSPGGQKERPNDAA